VIALSNGVEIEWDGSTLRHCTSKTKRKSESSNANAYSFFAGGNGNMAKLRLSQMLGQL
jgi:hypothetical protein